MMSLIYSLAGMSFEKSWRENYLKNSKTGGYSKVLGGTRWTELRWLRT